MYKKLLICIKNGKIWKNALTHNCFGEYLQLNSSSYNK